MPPAQREHEAVLGLPAGSSPDWEASTWQWPLDQDEVTFL